MILLMKEVIFCAKKLPSNNIVRTKQGKDHAFAKERIVIEEKFPLFSLFFMILFWVSGMKKKQKDDFDSVSEIGSVLGSQKRE